MNNYIPNNFYRISIKALILDEKKRFLLFREDNGKWEMPGGGLDHGEQPQQCLIREIKEESGLTITSFAEYPSYFVLGTSSRGQPKGIVVYEGKLKDLTFEPSDECQEIGFFTKDEALSEQLHDSTRNFVMQYDPNRHHTP